MMQQGLLVANDTNTHRVRDLYNNLERWGVQNTIVLNDTPKRLADHFGAFFDKVLVDAPCSGDGMFRKDPSSVFEWREASIKRCSNRQDDILREAARLVRPGGSLVYSTCTFAPEENEGTIYRFIRTHPEFEVEDIKWMDGFSAGRPDWLHDYSFNDFEPPPTVLSRTVRLWPHVAQGEGHYIALLQKKRENKGRCFTSKLLPRTSLLPDALANFHAFSAETLKREINTHHLSQHGSFLYLVPDGLPDIHGLRVVHWGWWLGTFKTRRFEPSQALVMALTPDELKQTRIFRTADSELMAYTRGEVISDTGPDGWVMVGVDGFPIGWAKRVQGRLKPRFPRWLMRSNR
jgi:NOL1/NOP2/fmu family ribosome biogenesis protein/SAM-dependent methyltransferase